MILLLPGIRPGFVRRMVRPGFDYGYLVGDYQKNRANLDILRGFRWGADSGCYGSGESFDFDLYMAYLWRIRRYAATCLFVTVPDVVGDAAETARRWKEYAPHVRPLGLPLAYVAQDGLEELPDADYQCLFIGGSASTEYKLSATAARLAQQAKAAGKWVHMGRVNSATRLKIAYNFGCDSADGTGLARQWDHQLRDMRAELGRQQAQAALL